MNDTNKEDKTEPETSCSGHVEPVVSLEIESLRHKLTKFIDHKTGREIRNKIHELAKKNYNPIHSSKYLEFMNDNACIFNVNHGQSANYPYYFTLFTEKSQHVMGDCIEECLDKAISS